MRKGKATGLVLAEINLEWRSTCRVPVRLGHHQTSPVTLSIRRKPACWIGFYYPASRSSLVSTVPGRLSSLTDNKPESPILRDPSLRLLIRYLSRVVCLVIGYMYTPAVPCSLHVFSLTLIRTTDGRFCGLCSRVHANVFHTTSWSHAGYHRYTHTVRTFAPTSHYLLPSPSPPIS